METLKEKICIKCKIKWPLATGFYNNKEAKDGKNCWCKLCCDANTRAHEKRRRTEPMSPQATATEELYAQRFRVIKAAGLSMDVQGLKVCRQIDRVLQDHGLYGDIREAPVSLNTPRFKGR